MADRVDDRPGHRAVAAAVAETDDPELASWVADPAGYVLVPVPFPPAERCDFFALTPVDASHPVAVLLARAPDGVMVTSGRPEAVWRVLRTDPALADPKTVVALLAPLFDVTEYLGPGGDPPMTSEGDGWRCDVLVRDGPGGAVQRWRILLAGTPSWQVDPPS